MLADACKLMEGCSPQARPGEGDAAAGAPMKAVAGYRGVLQIREARVLIGASAVSQVGDWLYNAALLGYVFSATHSGVWVGAATICRLLPYVLLGPLGGADRGPSSPPQGAGRGKPVAPGDHARYWRLWSLATARLR